MTLEGATLAGLEAVTHGENVRRSHSVRDGCKRGHPLTADNVYIAPKTGIRACRTCKRMHNQKYKAGRRRG